MTALFNGICPLPQLGVVRAQGADAVSFLHGQLTHDFALLDLQHARLTAFLSAKGRMQASFIGFKRTDTDVLLICSADLLPATLKRLSMFVMRAKAVLADASADFSIYGLAGSAIENIAGSAMDVGAKVDLDQISVVALASAPDMRRALWVAPVGTPAPSGAPLSAALWAWAEVQSGVATLTAPLVDAFVPQMLNYESVDGVSFKKGCYPGQEIVARSQFRGAIKRRGFLVHADTVLTVGDEIFTASDPDQPCGLVVQAAPAPAGGWDAIISAQIGAVQADTLHLGSSAGAALSLQALPYGLREDL